MDEQGVGVDSVEDGAYGEEGGHTAVVEAGDDSDVAHIGDDGHTDSGHSHLAFVEAEVLPIQVRVDTVHNYFGEVVEYGGEGAARNEVVAVVDDVIVGRMDDDVHVEAGVGKIEHAQGVEDVAGVGVDYAAVAEPVVVAAAKAAAHTYEADNAHDFSAPHWQAGQ